MHDDSNPQTSGNSTSDSQANNVRPTTLSFGGEKVIQPPESLKQELQSQPQQGLNQVSPDSISSSTQTDFQPTQQSIPAQPNSNAPNNILTANSLNVATSPKNHKKKIIIACVALVTTVILVVGYLFLQSNTRTGDPNNPASWKNYTNSQAGFSAMFIRQPEHQTTTHGNGDLYLSKTSDNQNEYTVGVARGTTDITSFIKGQVDALTNGAIQSQKTTTVDGHSATDVTFNGLYKGQQENFTARIIVNSNDLYEVYTIGYGSPAINSQYFIDNFKLTQ